MSQHTAFTRKLHLIIALQKGICQLSKITMSAFEDNDADLIPEEDIPTLEVPQGGEDWDGAEDAKSAANEAKASGNYDLAIENFTKCLELGSTSAITLANRADCLLRARRPLGALADCNAALKINPDSAKALRMRGKVHRHLGNWEEANRDLAASQSIDFDPDTEELRRLASEKAAELEAQRVQQRLADEEALREKVRRQREEMARRAKEEAEEEEERARQQGGMPGGMGEMPGGMGGMPGMGGMGGIPGMGGMGGMPGGGGGGGMDGMQAMLMQLLMSDPELAAGMQNPKVMKAFSGMMGGGAGGGSSDMEDPEVKAFMTKLSAKLGPMMGMMGGMGGMGGMEGMGSMPEGDEDEEDNDDDDLPDLEEQEGAPVGPTADEVD